jgi:dephospho-CoA kinase
MLKVGLTGGIASGKSSVGRAFEDLGCLLIRNDELGHAVLAPGGEAYDATIAEFGPAILHEDGRINRRKLASIVFKDKEKLQRLNGFVHPPVRERTRRALDDYAKQHPHGIAIVEAAILVETGSWRDYDRLIVAVCGREQQIERAMARDGITREEVLERLNRQMPLEEKLRFADYVIDTSGTKEETSKQVKAVYESLMDLRLQV